MTRKSQRFLWKEGDRDGKKDDPHPKFYNEHLARRFALIKRIFSLEGMKTLSFFDEDLAHSIPFSTWYLRMELSACLRSRAYRPY